MVFDADGLESLYGPASALARAVELRVGLPANIAIACNPDAAMHAAQGLNGRTVIAPGYEAKTLAPLPLYLLGASDGIGMLLDQWGVYTFGTFAALPSTGIAARLGQEGIALQRLARGGGNRQLRVIQDARVFDAETEFDSPVELLESLLFVLAHLLNGLLAKMAPLATNEVRTTLKLKRGADHVVTVRLPVPTLDGKTVLKLLHLELAENPPPEAIVKVHLNLEPVVPRRTQYGLFAPASPEAERLETTLARVRHLVGKENVGSPFLLDTRRPDRFAMHPFLPSALSPKAPVPTARELKLCLRRYRPPREAQVKIENKRPTYVRATPAHGSIVTARGPWRTSGNWWNEDVWNRDRWDVVLESGVLLRIFQQLDTKAWFLEGCYD